MAGSAAGWQDRIQERRLSLLCHHCSNLSTYGEKLLICRHAIKLIDLIFNVDVCVLIICFSIRDIIFRIESYKP